VALLPTPRLLRLKNLLNLLPNRTQNPTPRSPTPNLRNPLVLEVDLAQDRKLVLKPTPVAALDLEVDLVLEVDPVAVLEALAPEQLVRALPPREAAQEVVLALALVAALPALEVEVEAVLALEVEVVLALEADPAVGLAVVLVALEAVLVAPAVALVADLVAPEAALVRAVQVRVLEVEAALEVVPAVPAPVLVLQARDLTQVKPLS